MEITELTVHELQEKLKNKELTVSEITKAYVDRINEKEKDVKAIAIDGAIAGITKDYLKPGDTRVLAASKMVGGGEQTSVRFPVKKIKDGGYDFFCSFLGHERKMHGKLIVE